MVIAPERHVLFRYTAKHDGAAVDGLLDGYEGYLVADAHAVFDHLYKRGTLIEVACWAHARRYWWKALETDPDRARQALAYIGGLFRVEREAATVPPEARLATRRAESKAIVDGFFTWCEAEAQAGPRRDADREGHRLRPEPAGRVAEISRRRPPPHPQQWFRAGVAAGSGRKEELALRRHRRCRRDQCRLRLAARELPTPRRRALGLPPRPLLPAAQLADSSRTRSRAPQLERRLSRTRTLSSGSTPMSSGAPPSACSATIPQPSSTGHGHRQRRCSPNGYERAADSSPTTNTGHVAAYSPFAKPKK